VTADAAMKWAREHGLCVTPMHGYPCNSAAPFAVFWKSEGADDLTLTCAMHLARTVRKVAKDGEAERGRPVCPRVKVRTP